jgi:hypothetical protein
MDCADGEDERGCPVKGSKMTALEKESRNEISFGNARGKLNPSSHESSPYVHRPSPPAKIESVTDIRRDASSIFSKRTDMTLDRLHSLNCRCSCEPLDRAW